MTEPPVSSRRLRAFQRACARGGPRAFDRNWRDLTRHGLPLIERVPGHRDRRLVTFLWRPVGRVTAPSLYTPVGGFSRADTELHSLGTGGVWYRSCSLDPRTRASYGFSPRPLPDLAAGEKAWNRYMRSVRYDPFSSSNIHFEKDPDDPSDYALTLSVFELPRAPRPRWQRPTRVSYWTEEHLRLRSRRLRNVRSVWVYRPADYRRGARYNLLIVFDGPVYRESVPTPRIVENLVAAGRIAPTVVVVLGNARGARTRDLFLNPALPAFLAHELLPWLRHRYALKTRASGTVLAGSSLGGLASADAALRYPGLFGNVLAQSGAFQAVRPRKRGSSVSLMQRLARAPRLPLRFYLEVGTHEEAVGTGMTVSLLGSVRHLRDVLQAKGYPFEYAEFQGGHDYACWRGSLGDGIEYLLGHRRRSLSDRS